MNYVLSERAARWLEREMAKSASYNASAQSPSRLVRRDFAGGGGSPPFHFRYQHSSATSGGTTTHTVTIGEGAVQLGGFTHFVSSGSVSGMASGTVWICVQIALSSGTGSFVAYQSTAALNAAQLDVTKYIFPIYKVTDYAVVLDYRPMPNAGVWEDETLVSVPSS